MRRAGAGPHVLASRARSAACRRGPLQPGQRPKPPRPRQTAPGRGRRCRRSSRRSGPAPGTPHEGSRAVTVDRVGLVLLERSLHPQFVSNTYLVAAEPGGDGVLIDAGGPMQPLYEAIDNHGVNVTHLLL